MQPDPSPSEQLAAALRFVRDIARARSTSVVAIPGGEAVLNADFPDAHDLNRLLITGPGEPADLAASADEVLGGAGLKHRLISVHDATQGRTLGDAMASYGYAGSEDLLMAATGAAQRQPPAHAVVELGISERAAISSADWRRDQPAWDESVVRQLGSRIQTMPAAAQCTFFAVRGADDAVRGRADLYLRDGVAQIEEVMTNPAHSGRGVASALVLHAVERALGTGAGLVFLIADADDWPKELYRRLGFSDLGRTVNLTRL